MICNDCFWNADFNNLGNLYNFGTGMTEAEVLEATVFYFIVMLSIELLCYAIFFVKILRRAPF